MNQMRRLCCQGKTADMLAELVRKHSYQILIVHLSRRTCMKVLCVFQQSWTSLSSPKDAFMHMLVPACIAAAGDICWKESLPKKQSGFRLIADAAEPSENPDYRQLPGFVMLCMSVYA